MGTAHERPPEADEARLIDAARLLGIDSATLNERVRQGAVSAYRDAMGTWFIVIPEGESVGEGPWASAEGQIPRVMARWLVPLVRQIAAQGEEIGRLKADLRQEGERRDAAIQGLADRHGATAAGQTRYDALEGAAKGQEVESIIERANVAPDGAESVERASERPQRWPWWMRILGGK